MSKSAAILGLVALASAGAPAYSGAAAYSSAAPVYESSSVYYSAEPSSSYAWPVSSAAPIYPASSAAAVYGSSSWVVSAIPSSSYPYYPSASSAAAVIPSAPPYPACWTACFEEAGVTSESELCGNVEVDACITKGCCQEESWAYWQWVCLKSFGKEKILK
jgi:hypothetical protein